MKTNPSPKIFKYATFAAAWIAMALVTQSVMAQANQLVLEENSSTSLTVTYTPIGGSTTNLTVLGLGTDSWDVLLPMTFSGPGVSASWSEPGSADSSNLVDFLVSTSATVFSDHSGTGLPDEFPIFVGFDTSNNQAIDATFDDDAATAEAPDTGSTFALLFLALTALFGANRLPSIRLA
jgi:hypothetical protein